MPISGQPDRTRARRRWRAWVIVACLLPWLGAAARAGQEGEDNGGWQSLFNGRDLAGWTVQCRAADRGHPWWRVEDGVLVADSMDRPRHDYVWLVSEKEYGDFVLRLQFQALRGNPGNSGVQIRSRYDVADDGGWLNGPQVDIHPPDPWRTGMIWDETRTNQRWLFPAIPRGTWVNEAMARPGLRFRYADDTPAWNDFEITAEGTRVRVVLNGIEVTDYDGAGTLDDPAHRERRVGLQGHIALQIHTGDALRIRYRGLEIKPLVPASPAPPSR